MTRRLRHRLGHWLLRDVNPPVHHVNMTTDNSGRMHFHVDGRAVDELVHAALLKRKRKRGGGSLGLS